MCTALHDMDVCNTLSLVGIYLAQTCDWNLVAHGCKAAMVWLSMNGLALTRAFRRFVVDNVEYCKLHICDIDRSIRLSSSVTSMSLFCLYFAVNVVVV